MDTQSSVDTKVKVGIIGFGRMGRFYWEAMRKSGRWDIAYICDTNPESRQLAKEVSSESLIVEDNQCILRMKVCKLSDFSLWRTHEWDK